MYEFIDTNEQQAGNHLPSEALFIDGVAIEDAIEGYTTLTVSGRELMGQELNTVRRIGSDGAIYLNESYPPRTITIQYELKAKDNQDFRLKFERLNQLLTGGEKELKFADDMEYSFKGALSEVSDVPKGRNVVIGTFSFYCSDPFKYSEQIITEGLGFTLVYDDTFLIKPDFVELSLTHLTDEIMLWSGKKLIKILNYSFLEGEQIKFDFENNRITNTYLGDDEIDLTEYLSLDSNWEDFYIFSGEEIWMEHLGTIKVAYRRKAL